MTSHRTHIDSPNFSEQISDQIQSMRVHDNNSYGKLFDGINKKIDHDVEARLKKSDYVAAPGQPDLASAAERAVDQAMGSGFHIIDDGMAKYGRGLDGYADRARVATREIDSRERVIAQKHWDALSPAERKTIEKEMAEREDYERVMVYHTKYSPPATPHLNAFTKGVEQAIAPLERERDAKLHKVWHDLPAGGKAAIYRSQEEAKHFKFV